MLQRNERRRRWRREPNRPTPPPVRRRSRRRTRELTITFSVGHYPPVAFLHSQPIVRVGPCAPPVDTEDGIAADERQNVIIAGGA